MKLKEMQFSGKFLPEELLECKTMPHEESFKNRYTSRTYRMSQQTCFPPNGSAVLLDALHLVFLLMLSFPTCFVSVQTAHCQAFYSFSVWFTIDNNATELKFGWWCILLMKTCLCFDEIMNLREKPGFKKLMMCRTLRNKKKWTRWSWRSLSSR